MSVQNITRRAGPYVGTGLVSAYTFAFKVFRSEDVKVVRSASSDANAQDETLTLGTDYTVKLNADQNEKAGGTVTLVSPLAEGLRLSILSAITPDQQMVLTNHDGMLPTTLNDSADKAIALIQELQELLGRGITVPATSAMSPAELLNELVSAAKDARLSAEEAQRFAEICEEIKQNIFIYSWDIPHVVDTLDDVEKYPFDGFFAVGGYGDPGHHGQDISNRVVKALGSTKLRTLGERFSDVVNVRDFGAVGNGVHDDTEAIQAAIDFAAGRSCGGEVYFPSGTYLQSATLILKSKVYLAGVDGTTDIIKAKGMLSDALKTEHFEELSNLEDQQASPLMPRDFGIDGINFKGNYLAKDVTESENSIVNAEGGGLKIIGSRFKLNCSVLNQAGIGVFIQSKGKFNQSDKLQNSSIRLNINTCKYEGLIFDGPADIFIDSIFSGNAGSGAVPGEGSVAVGSPTFGSSNGGLCDNVVFVQGAEVGFLHAWGSYHGVGVRVLGGRFNADFLISESNVCGHLVCEGDSFGAITKILSHGGGGGGNLRQTPEKYPDIHIKTNNKKSFYIGSIFTYPRSAVDHAQDKIVIDSSFTTVSDIRIIGQGCSGNGLVIKGSYTAFDNVTVLDLVGNSCNGNASAAIVREAASSTFTTRVNAQVTTSPVVFRSKGKPKNEDIHISFSVPSGCNAFEGDSPTFGHKQHWQIHGTVGGVQKGTWFKARVAFDPQKLEEQTLTVKHDLITTMNPSDVLLTMQDTGTTLNSGMIQFMYVNAVTESDLVVKLKMKEAGNSSSPYITVVAEI